MFMCHSMSSPAPVADTGILPYFGTASVNAAKDQALVLSLQYRGATADRTNPAMTLTSGANISMYYAYPVSYGFATFLDTDSQMEGGWDGFYADTTGDLGPGIITVNGVSFYLYKTDWPNLGLTHWKVY